MFQPQVANFKFMPQKKPKIVCLGAGTGQATVLSGLKDYQCDLTGIVNVTDNGGSSGVLRREMNIPQPGDTRQCLQAVAVSGEDLMTKLFAYRFKEGFLKGGSLGNFILAALTRITGDFGQGVEMAARLLKTEAKIYPVTSASVDVACELENGRKIRGEWNIILRADRTPIKKMFLTKKAQVYPPCLEALRRADLIVIGPGSLFTGIIPHFLVRGVKEAIMSSKGKKVYICNMMSQPGQTDGFKVSDHVRQVARYLGQMPDYVIANRNAIGPRILKHYRQFGSVPVELDRVSDVKMIIRSLAQNELGEAVHLDKRSGKRFREWSEWTHLLRHDAKKLAKILINLVQ